jgi:hypothetical protein
VVKLILIRIPDYCDEPTNQRVYCDEPTNVFIVMNQPTCLLMCLDCLNSWICKFEANLQDKYDSACAPSGS